MDSEPAAEELLGKRRMAMHWEEEFGISSKGRRVRPRHMRREGERQLPPQPAGGVFPFMSLPAELRLRIYYMALVRHEPIFLHVDRFYEGQPYVTNGEATDVALAAPTPAAATPLARGPDILSGRSAGPTPRDVDSFDAHDAVGETGLPLPPSDRPTPLQGDTLQGDTLQADTIQGGTAQDEVENDASQGGTSQGNTSGDALPPRPTRPSSPTDDPIRMRDPIVPTLLCLNKQIYKEARQLLYAENTFQLSLTTGVYTLSTLHQRSRSLIKHVILTIPSHHDILDGFADLVRLGLRYCWGLKSFRIILLASIPDDSLRSNGSATSVYANAFHILRWLPRGCTVKLEGRVSETVKRVVNEEGRLMNVLDEVSYLKRQHQMPERN